MRTRSRNTSILFREIETAKKSDKKVKVIAFGKEEMGMRSGWVGGFHQ